MVLNYSDVTIIIKKHSSHGGLVLGLEYLTKKQNFILFLGELHTLRRFSITCDYCIGLKSILLLDLEVYCKSFQKLDVTSKSSPENHGAEHSINRLNGIDVSAQQKSSQRREKANGGSTYSGYATLQ